MTDKTYNVLFLCTGNSARSIMAEGVLNLLGKGRFTAYSAGSFPTGKVHPLSLEMLHSLGIGTGRMRSKSWDEFAGPDAPKMDFVFTVCDQAAGEACPLWPGNPVTAHWGIPDPAAVEGAPEAKRQAFRDALTALQTRIRLFVSLPIEKLDRMALKRKAEEIGHTSVVTDRAS